jgi:hypothetical protein
MGAHQFGFHVKDKTDIPTCTLLESLKALKKSLEEIKEIPSVISPDELSVVEPLKAVLDQVLEGCSEKPDVRWQPPPSPEEAAYSMLCA